MLLAMRSPILALCGLVACGHAQPAGDLLERVSKKVLDMVDRLPRYMCTETIDRFQYEPPPSRVEAPCEPDRRLRPHLTTSDRLRLDVAISASHEMYSWVGESHFEDRSLFDLVGSGALSTGSFSSFLLVVFRTDNTAFSYKGPLTEGGRTLEEFEYHVPKPMSHYFYKGEGTRVITGYYGDILVDPQTADLVRLEVHTEGLPPETGACQTNSTLDYSRLRLNDTDFLLPKRSELQILNANGVEMRNITVFSGCHEFLGESTLSFDSAPGPGEAAASKSGTAAGDLPAGLPFRIAFDRKIDPASAAAGDRVTAKLTGPIRDGNHRVLVPRGAAVSLRILALRRFYDPVPALRMTLKPETVEIGGTARPLAAEPDTRPVPVVTGGRMGMERRPGMVMLVLHDNQDAHAAVIQFLNIGMNFVVEGGSESNWFTAARKP